MLKGYPIIFMEARTKEIVIYATGDGSREKGTPPNGSREKGTPPTSESYHDLNPLAPSDNTDINFSELRVVKTLKNLTAFTSEPHKKNRKIAKALAKRLEINLRTKYFNDYQSSARNQLIITDYDEIEDVLDSVRKYLKRALNSSYCPYCSENEFRGSLAYEISIIDEYNQLPVVLLGQKTGMQINGTEIYTDLDDKSFVNLFTIAFQEKKPDVEEARNINILAKCLKNNEILIPKENFEEN